MNRSKTANLPSHPDYRADIDGLRALAILPVVMFHAFPEYMRSGFVGVDIFFVISGYLISSIIHGGLRSGSFSFLDFYARRAKRLFPALLVVLGGTYLFAYLSFFPSEYQQFGKHLAAGAGYAENILLLQEVGYFDIQAQLKPLMHLWSLSVEEQFYFVFPVFLWLAWAALKNRVIWAIMGVAAISFACNVVVVQSNVDMAYFAPQTRFWELLAGSVLAYQRSVQPTCFTWWPRALLKYDLQIASALSVLGFVLVFLSVFAFTRNELYPGWWALFPVAGAYLLILAGPKAFINRTLLSNRTLVAVGLISYPLYLWHWPLLSFGRILSIKAPDPIVQCSLVVASFILAWGTFRFLERPFKNWAVRDSLKVSLMCGLLAGFVVLGLLVAVDLLPRASQPSQLVANLEKAKKDWEFPPAGFVAVKSDSIYALTHSNTATATKVLFFGDSNLEQYGGRIARVISESPAAVANIVLVPIQKNCDILNAVISGQGCSSQLNALQAIARDSTVKKVVLIVAWIKYEERLADPANLNKVANFLKSLAQGKHLFIVRNIPIDPTNLAPDSQISRGLSLGGGAIEVHPRASTVDVYKRRFSEINGQLLQIARLTDANLVSTIDYLCPDGICLAVDGGSNFLYVDAGHLTASYARKAAVYIDPLLEP